MTPEQYGKIMKRAFVQELDDIMMHKRAFGAGYLAMPIIGSLGAILGPSIGRMLRPAIRAAGPGAERVIAGIPLGQMTRGEARAILRSARNLLPAERAALREIAAGHTAGDILRGGAAGLGAGYLMMPDVLPTAETAYLSPQTAPITGSPLVDFALRGALATGGAASGYYGAQALGLPWFAQLPAALAGGILGWKAPSLI